MTANPSQVIVTVGFTPQTVQVYHRVLPELHADGESADGRDETGPRAGSRDRRTCGKRSS